jgi:hypothetical protein
MSQLVVNGTWFYTRERWNWDYFIVSHAARMASNAGNDEIILLFSAREYNTALMNEHTFDKSYNLITTALNIFPYNSGIILDNHLHLQQLEYCVPYLYVKPMIFHSIVDFDEKALKMKLKPFGPHG